MVDGVALIDPRGRAVQALVWGDTDTIPDPPPAPMVHRVEPAQGASYALVARPTDPQYEAKTEARTNPESPTASSWVWLPHDSVSPLPYSPGDPTNAVGPPRAEPAESPPDPFGR